MLNKIAAKHIRAAAKAAGYDFWSSYNDKGAHTRRVKMMINGHDYGHKQYTKWDAKIRKELDRLGVPYLDAGFQSCYGGRGEYQAYCVVLRNDGEPATPAEINRAYSRLERAEVELNAASEALIELVDDYEDSLGDMLQTVGDTLAEIGEAINDHVGNG